MYRTFARSNLTAYDRIKPPKGALLDWASPLAKGLVLYLPFLEVVGPHGAGGFAVRDLVSGVVKFPSSATAVTAAAGDGGGAVNFTGASSSQLLWNVATAPAELPFMIPLEAADNPFTLGCKLRYTSAVQDSCVAGFNSSGTAQWYMITGRAAPSVSAGSLGISTVDTSYTFTAGTSYNDGKWYTAFIYHVPGNGQGVVVFDSAGALLENVSGATTAPTGGSATNFGVGGGNGGVALWGGNIEWLGVWNQQLDLNRMRMLATAPYQLLRPTPRRWQFKSGTSGTAFTSNLAGSLTPAAAIANAVAKPLAGGVTETGAIQKAASKSAAGSITEAGAPRLLTTKPLAGSVTMSGALAMIRLVLVSLAGSITATGTIVRAASKSLAGSISESAAVAKLVQLARGGSASPSGSDRNTISKPLAGSITFSGIATLVRVVLRTITGSLTAAGAIAKQAQKALSGSASYGAVITRSISAARGGSLTLAGGLAKAIARALSGAISFLGSLVLGIQGTVELDALVDPVSATLVFDPAHRVQCIDTVARVRVYNPTGRHV